MMKYFLFADPHGHYNELKEALLAAGYDETNKDHQLIGLGDYFDRGNQNDKMATFLIDQWKKGKGRFIFGNHDEMLYDFLRGTNDGYFNAYYNGFGKTIENLAGIGYWQEIEFNLDFIVQKIKQNYPDLLEFLHNTEDKIEIGDYVITHAGYSNKADNFYKTDQWEIDNWGRTDKFVESFAMSDEFNISKKYIFGHWHAYDLRLKFQDGDGTITSKPFMYRNFIGLDACTVITKKVNIYIIEE